MKLKPTFILNLLFLTFLLSHPISSQNRLQEEFLFGLEMFKTGQYEYASQILEAVLIDPDSTHLHGDSLYWLGRVSIEQNSLEEGSQILRNFIENYPENPLVVETHYFLGRNSHHLGSYDDAVAELSQYLSRGDSATYYYNALYWMGEALFQLNELSSAEQCFIALSTAYTTGSKKEEILYKLNIIPYLKREQELLNILKWTNQAQIKEQNSFTERETKLLAQIEELTNQLAQLELASADFEKRQKLLDMKEETLRLLLNSVEEKGSNLEN